MLSARAMVLAFAFLPCAENQVGVDLEFVWVQAQREDVVVEFEVGHGAPYAAKPVSLGRLNSFALDISIRS